MINQMNQAKVHDMIFFVALLACFPFARLSLLILVLLWPFCTWCHSCLWGDVFHTGRLHGLRGTCLWRKPLFALFIQCIIQLDAFQTNRVTDHYAPRIDITCKVPHRLIRISVAGKVKWNALPLAINQHLNMVTIPSIGNTPIESFIPSFESPQHLS